MLMMAFGTLGLLAGWFAEQGGIIETETLTRVVLPAAGVLLFCGGLKAAFDR
jgi:hypothetical protein